MRQGANETWLKRMPMTLGLTRHAQRSNAQSQGSLPHLCPLTRVDLLHGMTHCLSESTRSLSLWHRRRILLFNGQLNLVQSS
jgi:hypothetical protein